MARLIGDKNGPKADTLTGTSKFDYISGLERDDVLYGSGVDTLHG